MKHLMLALLAVCSAGSLWAQQSVTVKEPSGQCYQDMKDSLPVIRFDDSQMMVVSRPLVTTTSGNVQIFARVFQEKHDTQCKIIVGIDSPDNSVAWNALNSSYLWRSAHLVAAKIDNVMKARQKAEKKAKSEPPSESK